MKKIVCLGATALLLCVANAFAEDEEQAELSPELLAEMAALPDNTGATSNSDNSADITGEGEGSAASGVVADKITIHRTPSGVDVYNGYNKVEAINEGSDGWVGTIVDNGSNIEFKPAGRPELVCPAQSLSSWFGPCEMVVAE